MKRHMSLYLEVCRGQHVDLYTADTQTHQPPPPSSMKSCALLLPDSGYGQVVQLDVLNDFIQ